MKVKFILPALTEAKNAGSLYDTRIRWFRKTTSQSFVRINREVVFLNHLVYRTTKLSEEELKQGYDWAYRDFHSWNSGAPVGVGGTLSRPRFMSYYLNALSLNDFS